MYVYMKAQSKKKNTCWRTHVPSGYNPIKDSGVYFQRIWELG